MSFPQRRICSVSPGAHPASSPRNGSGARARASRKGRTSAHSEEDPQHIMAHHAPPLSLLLCACVCVGAWFTLCVCAAAHCRCAAGASLALRGPSSDVSSATCMLGVRGRSFLAVPTRSAPRNAQTVGRDGSGSGCFVPPANVCGAAAFVAGILTFNGGRNSTQAVGPRAGTLARGDTKVRKCAKALWPS
jgi:hypothetical protein